MTPSVTVQVVPDPVTEATVGAVPPMPLPAFTVKLAVVTPVTLSEKVTVKTGADAPVVRATALLARTTEVTVGGVVSMAKVPPLVIVVPVLPARSTPETDTVAVPSAYVPAFARTTV